MRNQSVINNIYNFYNGKKSHLSAVCGWHIVLQHHLEKMISTNNAALKSQHLELPDVNHDDIHDIHEFLAAISPFRLQFEQLMWKIHSPPNDIDNRFQRMLLASASTLTKLTIICYNNSTLKTISNLEKLVSLELYMYDNNLDINILHQLLPQLRHFIICRATQQHINLIATRCNLLQSLAFSLHHRSQILGDSFNSLGRHPALQSITLLESCIFTYPTNLLSEIYSNLPNSLQKIDTRVVDNTAYNADSNTIFQQPLAVIADSIVRPIADYINYLTSQMAQNLTEINCHIRRIDVTQSSIAQLMMACMCNKKLKKWVFSFSHAFVVACTHKMIYMFVPFTTIDDILYMLMIMDVDTIYITMNSAPNDALIKKFATLLPAFKPYCHVNMINMHDTYNIYHTNNKKLLISMNPTIYNDKRSSYIDRMMM